MATKKQLQSALGGLGLGGHFYELINRAVRNDWDANEFLHQLIRTKAFKAQFPGLLTGNRINDFLAGGRDGITISNLGSAIARYKNLRESYQDVVQAKGLTGLKITPGYMKQLITGEISPDEFGRRAVALQTLKDNPDLMASYNAVLKAAGMKPLDDLGMRKFLAGAAQKKFYDVYEASRLNMANLGFSPQQSLQLAKGIGSAGELADVDQLVAAVRQHRADIGPELAAAGIDDFKLTSWLANPGVDPEGLAPKIQTIIANRRAMGQQQQGGFGRKGSGGGLALYEEQESKSY